MGKKDVLEVEVHEGHHSDCHVCCFELNRARLGRVELHGWLAYKFAGLAKVIIFDSGGDHPVRFTALCPAFGERGKKA